MNFNIVMSGEICNCNDSCVLSFAKEKSNEICFMTGHRNFECVNVI